MSDNFRGTLHHYSRSDDYPFITHILGYNGRIFPRMAGKVINPASPLLVKFLIVMYKKISLYELNKTKSIVINLAQIFLTMTEWIPVFITHLGVRMLKISPSLQVTIIAVSYPKMCMYSYRNWILRTRIHPKIYHFPVHIFCLTSSCWHSCQAQVPAASGQTKIITGDGKISGMYWSEQKTLSLITNLKIHCIGAISQIHTRMHDIMWIYLQKCLRYSQLTLISRICPSNCV